MKQYEYGLRLNQQHTKVVLSYHLRRRPHIPSTLKSLHDTLVLPDVESSTLSISRTLLPVVHKLKWSIKRDRLAKVIRGSMCGEMANGADTYSGRLGPWIERRGQRIFGDSERVRFALCPDVRKMIRFYETMSH